jgi:NADH dehydrogenase
LQDLPSLRVAMQGVHTIIHLAGARRGEGQYSDEWINHRGTENLLEAAKDTDVKRIIFLSHIHADRNSAFPLLRGKGGAEEAIRGSGLNFTVLRSSLIFGAGDSFTTVLAMIIKMIPFVFPVMGNGKTRFQPIHVDDVTACLAGCLDTRHLDRMTLPIGGPQHLSYSEILEAVKKAMHVRRWHLHLRMPLMRPLVALSESLFPTPLVSSAQLDLFSIDNTTDLGNVPRNFELEPRRFTESLGYLHRKGWRRDFLRYVYRKRPG